MTYILTKNLQKFLRKKICGKVKEKSVKMDDMGSEDMDSATDCQVKSFTLQTTWIFNSYEEL